MGEARASVDILVVEDNPADARLVKEAFAATRWRPTIHVARDGESALEMLRAPDAPQFQLILLDLNLPRLDGKEVLAIVKGDQALRQIPVIVLTSSRAKDDIRACYAHHANAYVVKAVSFDEFNETVVALAQFWLDWVVLPEG